MKSTYIHYKNTSATTAIQYRIVKTINRTVIPAEHLSLLIQSVESYARVYPGMHSPQAVPVLFELH